MTIQVGDKLPEVTFTTMTDEGPQPATTAELFDGRKVALFAVPGAFTPTCHLNHLPGFVEHAAAFKDKGVDTVACVSVNDIFVLNAWAQSTGAEGSIKFLADGNGEFAKATGLDLDASGFGMGLRLQRFAMVVNDGTVEVLNVEPQASNADVSSASALLDQL